jgi:uncharacterized protein involved in outer membrane biogenesis
MRLSKILIGVAVVLVFLIGIGAFALSQLDPNDYVGLLEAKVEENTGRSRSNEMPWWRWSRSMITTG